MEFLDGKKLQKKHFEEIKKLTTLLDIHPTLAIITINKAQIENMFYQQIIKMCKDLKYKVHFYHYKDISSKGLLALIEKLNQDPKITSILIEHPLPKYLDSTKIKNKIKTEKDVEGISCWNHLQIEQQLGGFVPCTALGIIMLLNENQINIREKNVVIINRSEIIGKPLAHYFLTRDCTITICHSKTKDLETILKNADIVITATAQAHFLNANIFKEGSIIIDAGMSEQEGKILGDVNFDVANNLIQYGARPIGGVGPMTITALAENILKSYYLNVKNNKDDAF